jgi:hypothetical protein
MQKVAGKEQPVKVTFAFYFLLLTLFLLGLGLRLLAWHWREFYPLGGDEREYLDQALTLLRDRQYVELRLMRPPLYPLFLAACIYIVDSLVQNLRLIQALISAATVPLVYLLTREVALRAGHDPARPALLAAVLSALSYTLAANATELLTEALFLFGLTAALWLLLRTSDTKQLSAVALAGLIIGALCLLRSVALPLLPLGALWLALNAKDKRQAGESIAQAGSRWIRAAAMPVLLFTFTFCLVVLPWTARNYVTYGGLILIDTTGAENLWLDNDPAGREAVKAQLYAMGDDRLARQQLATREGLAAITGDPARFAAKAWGELKKLFALEFSDDMLARPAIWVPPGEVWARLLLGDGIWLIVLLAGAYGMGQVSGVRDPGSGIRTPDPRLLLLPWALYVGLTTILFHVELRYRLPLYPALLPYAALALVGNRQQATGKRLAAQLLPIACCLLPIILTLLHANYPALAWQLGWKHYNLAQASAALARNDAEVARSAATAALTRDDESALARVDLARADLLANNQTGALNWLDAAIETLPAHPYAHLLRGDLLRTQGKGDTARADLTYETSSLEDLQVWSWERFVSPPPAQLDLGNGLDLGFITGFHSVAAGEEGFRWTKSNAQLRLTVPAEASALHIRAASGRPDNSPVTLRVILDGRELDTIEVAANWSEYRLDLPVTISSERVVVIELRSNTFTPRDYDRASPDGRQLGMQIDRVTVEE